MKLPKINKTASIKYGIGIGLGLFAIDHYPVNLFGLLLLFIFAVLYIKDNDYKTWDWGSKWVYIPMLVMQGVTLLRLIIYRNNTELFAVSFFAIAFILYMMSRKIGKEIVKVLITFLIVEVGCIVIMALINRGEIASGYIGQYNRAIGFMAYIAILNRGRWQWLLIMLAVLGIALTGSLEGLLVVGVLAFMVLVRKDFGNRLYVPLLLMAVCLLPLIFTGDICNLYTPVIQHLYLGDMEVSTALNGRIIVYKEALQNISFLGHGYTNSLFNAATVHNVPLIVFDQLGIFAGIAWIVIVVYCLIKTNWKYAWVAIIVMCLFDHFVWTGLAPYFFIVVGLTTASTNRDDYIFRLRG